MRQNSLLSSPTLSLIFASLFVVALTISCGGDDKASTAGAGPAKVQEANKELEKALAAHNAGDIQTAAQGYRKIILLDPQNKYAYYNLGVIEQAAGRQEQADGFYRIALSIDPAFGVALYNLAILRAEVGAISEAVDLYRRVIAVEPRNAAAYLKLGTILVVGGQREEGDAYIRKAIEIDPRVVQPISNAATPANSGPGAATPPAP